MVSDLDEGRTVTKHEKELIAALEGDIQKWEFVARYFEHSVNEIELMGGKTISGRDYALGLYHQIAEHHALIGKVKKG
jgi:hypothetical protein